MATPRATSPRPLALLIIALLSAALACNLGGAPAATATPAANGAATPTLAGDLPTVEPGGPTATPAAADAEFTGPVEVSLTTGPGEFFLDDPALGLADLQTYQASLTVTFAGISAGQPLQWSETYALTRTSRDPAIRQLTVTRTGDHAAPDLFLAEFDGLAFERRGDAACTAAALDLAAHPIDRFAPAGFLDPVLGAEFAGNEAITGIDAAHYTFDERALGLLNLATATGDVWVALDGGYVVKYTLAVQGQAAYFGEGVEGALTLDYALTGPNAPADQPLTLPADCPPGRVPVPPLADATNLTDQPGALSFDTATSLAEASAYYQSDLPARGWTALAEPALLPPDPAQPPTTSIQDFTQGDLQLTVILTAHPTGAHVQLIMLRPVSLTGPTP